MKKYTLWIIIAVLVVSAAVTAYAMRDEPASEHDDANVPRTVEVKDKQGEETTNRLLSDIGTWSVKSCLVLDGEEYDLYATFDDPEKAIENVKEKCPDALTKLRRGSLTLGELETGSVTAMCLPQQATEIMSRATLWRRFSTYTKTRIKTRRS